MLTFHEKELRVGVPEQNSLQNDPFVKGREVKEQYKLGFPALFSPCYGLHNVRSSPAITHREKHIMTVISRDNENR